MNALKERAHWSKALPADACAEAVRWASKQESAAIAWRECKRPDWMLWLIGKLEKSEPYSEERKPLVRVACECARSAWGWMPEKSRAALETSISSISSSISAAAAAAYAADAAAAYAAYAAYANAAHAARVKAREHCADIVRKHYPEAPRLA